MFWFILLLALTCILAIVLAIVGRLIVSAFRIDILRGDEPEHWLAAMIVGTCTVTLWSGWCSYCGIGASDHLWMVLGAVMLLFGATIVRGEVRQLLKVSAPRWWLVAIGGILAARAGFYLAPLLSSGSHILYTDALLYIPPADFLSQHGFGLVAPAVDQPVDALISAYHRMSHRMGPIFLHGLVTACVPQLGAFELFPVMIALGTILTLAATFLIARWCFQVSRACAVLGLLIVAVLIHTLGVAATGGCLCQLFGMAVLGLAIAVMPNLLEPVGWTKGNAVLAGSLVAFQMSMYSELTPVLALVSVVWIAVAARVAVGASALRRFAWFVAACAFFAALCANIELVRCWRGVQVMMAINIVGCHIDWTPQQFAAFALGGNTNDYVFDRPLEGWRYTLTVATMSALFAAGLSAWRHRRAIFAVTGLAVFAGLFAFFSLFRNDPWTGQVGHSWNLFTICKWAFPLIAATQIAGLAALLGLLKSHRLAQGMLFALVATVALQHSNVNRRVSRQLAQHSNIRAGKESPYAAAGKLRTRLATLNGPIHLVRVPELQADDPLAAGLLYPHRMVNTWQNAMHYGVPPLLNERPDAYGPATNYLFFGALPFQTPLECLPFTFVRLDPDHPALVRVDFSNRIFVPGHDKVVVLNDTPAICWIFASRAAEWELTLELTQPVGTPGGQLNVTTSGSLKSSAVSVGAVEMVLPLKLERGMNRVELKWSGQPCEAGWIGMRRLTAD